MNKKTTAQPLDGALQSVYMFTGEVDSRRTAAVDKLIEQMIDPAFTTFDLEKFDGDSAAAENVLAAVSTVPFGSPRKVVVVDRIERMNVDSQSKIAAFIPKLGPQSCLILLATEDSSSKRKTNDDDSQKRGKGLKSDLISAVKKHGSVVTFSKLKNQDLSTLIMQTVRAKGKTIEPSVLQTLTRLLEGNPASLDCEIEKLVIYTDGNDTITIKDVEKVVSWSPEDRIFPLIDAVAAGRPDTAVHLLNETFAASAKPDSEVLKVISMLGRHFRLLYQTKFLAMHREIQQEDMNLLLMNELNPLRISDWQRNKLLEQARHFTEKDLQRCLKQILLCELAAKGLGHDAGSPRMTLEMLILRLSQRKSIPLI